MKKVFVIVVLVLLTAFGVSQAADRGTANEAKAMVKKAVAYYNQNGQENAFREFNNPRGRFVVKDLYIWVLDMQGNCIAHEANPKLMGKNFKGLKDADGKPFIKEIIDIADKKGSGWVDYKWTHPETKNVEKKSSYFEKARSTIIICGFYK